jgi:hypothetical protein
MLQVGKSGWGARGLCHAIERCHPTRYVAGRTPPGQDLAAAAMALSTDSVIGNALRLRTARL